MPIRFEKHQLPHKRGGGEGEGNYNRNEINVLEYRLLCFIEILLKMIQTQAI
uniref:Uncharacterized protein n=1 Tax=Ascaris lumbricoides TaxID=6252 RepID=A0A0M3ITE2_ASCLU